MMPIAARRTCRIAGVVALATAVAYGIGIPLPYLAPLMAFMLTANPAPPPGLKGLVGLVVAVAATLSIGLLMIPLLLNYPVTAVLIIAVGLYLSSIISLEKVYA